MNKPLVYIAGPYTNPDPVLNVREAVRYADLFRAWSIIPIVPHLTHLWHMVSPKPYEEWLEYDLEVMRRCDAVYRFGGPSQGADGEVAEAVALGIPVFYSGNIEALWDWTENYLEDNK
jgi:hypothetical protein